MSSGVACGFSALVLAVVLAGMATTAAAVIPEHTCVMDPDAGRLWPAEDGRGAHPVWPTLYPGGVVALDWFDAAGRPHGLVQHCASGQTLRYAMPRQPEVPAQGLLYQMLSSETVYSFDDLRRALRDLGGSARIVGSPGSCACERPVWTVSPPR